jgi:hypothetical protein
MKLYKALREKNLLVGKIKELSMKIHRNNTIISGNEFDYDILELMTERDVIMSDLINLKLKIHKATIPAIESIYTLAELKAKSQMLQGIPTESGTITERFGDGVIEKVRILSPKDLEKLRKEIVIQIGKIQDQLDVFNHQTDI